MQAQIQVLLAVVGEIKEVVLRPNTGLSIRAAKSQVFDGTSGKILEFLIACKLFIRIKMREDVVEDQIQQILLYIQGEFGI